MKEGLIYVSDRLGQLRYSDKDEKIRWLQPLSSYKALVDIKRGQAVSVATTSEIESVLKDEQLAAYNEDPSPYIVPTNTSIHNRCIGLALETVEFGDDVHILGSGQFEYITNNTNEYSPKFTAEHISKKVYVSNVPGELTTDSEVAYEHYKNIIQIGHIIDAPQVEKEKQNTIVLEIQIQGDDRGILESTQFEAVLGENVCINKDEPLTVFAFGQEEASKFKLKLCTRTTTLSEEQLKTSFIVIKKLSGEYSLIKFSENEISTDDDTDLGTLKLLESRYTPTTKTTIESIDFTNSESSINTIIKALNNAIKEMGEDLKFEQSEHSTDNDFSSVTLELNKEGGYYDIYISNSLKDFLRDTTVLQNGSYNNKNTAILADIRIDARRNVFGVLVNSFDSNTILEKGSRILLMRQGELVVNTERELPAIGKKFVLGESGAVVSADDALRTADSSNTIGYLKKEHNLSDGVSHYHFVIDIGENIPKVDYSTYPVGYLKPYYGSLVVGEETPDFGYLLTGKQYPKKGYEEIYERLLGWYDESDINEGEDRFKIPEIRDSKDRLMQIKYVTDGIFERLPKVPYLRDFGTVSETKSHACEIKDLDITALLSINTTFSEVDTLPLENLDIHLYIDPDYTEGEHNWREVYPGFYKYNNVDTYGFEWKIKKELAAAEDIYGKYILSAEIGDSRGIYYTSSDNLAPISCNNVPYKLYVAVKQKNIEHFDLRNLMSNYISSTVYNNNGEIDDVYAVTGEAVINAIKNNKWFKYLKNETEDSVIDFGGTKKLNTDVNIQTNEVIRLNCEVETTSKNSVLIGETTEEIEGKITKYTTLEIKDGKAFLNKLNTFLFALNNDKNFVNDGKEVATIKDVLDHALMSIDGNPDTVKNAIKNNSNNDEGSIHGMKFGKGGNVDASTLCNYKVGIAYGQEITQYDTAIVSLIHKDATSVHTPLQGNIDYYTNLNNDDKSTKLFTLVPSYETTEKILNLAFTKDEDPVNKISFGGATIVAATESPSLSRYKTIYKENKLDRVGQFTTELDEDSKPADDDNISFDFAYILQAAYELPMAYWKYRNSDEYNIGPIIERLQDTINYFENTEGDITYTVDGDEDPYKYTPKQKSGIAKSLKDIIAESGKSVRADDMVGFLLAAAGETQKRLAKLERSTYGRDVMEETKINFVNMPDINSGHTKFGLNRLVRAICLELFKTADPGKLDDFFADENTQTSLSRIDDIERQIRGSRNSPDKDNGSITNNSINDFDAADPDNDDVRYSISNSYPYSENVRDNSKDIEDEDTFSIAADKKIIDTKETIFGTEAANDKDSFNGIVDAIYRITQKVDVLTEAINGTNDILQPHTTLNKIKRNIETLIKEVYFDGKNDEDAYKDILGKGETFDETKESRVDKITEDLYTYRLNYVNCGDDQDLTSSEKLTKYDYPNAFYDSNNKKFDIVSPENIAQYNNNLSIIDIILKAIGNQILLKHYSDQDGSIKKLRFNKDISQRLYDIEQCLDKIVLKLKDNKNFESFESTNDSTTILNLDDFNDALSKLLGYTPKENPTEEDKFISSSGVVPGAEDNSDKYSAEYALRTKSHIVAGLENILYRVQNEEKDNLHIKEVLGNELMKGVFVKATEAGNGEQDIQTIAPIVDPKNFNLSDDIKDLLATIYGEPRDPDSESQPNAGNNTTYKHRTIARGTNGSFLNGENIIEKIVNELYYIPKPFDSNFNSLENENLEPQNVIYVNHNTNVDSDFFTGSLIDGNNREKNFVESGRKSRLDILESDVKALRNFIGLTGLLEDTQKDDITTKKNVAVNGNFDFEKIIDFNTNTIKYSVINGEYVIGEKDPLTSSFIESFFNLMKRVDKAEKDIEGKLAKTDLDDAINKININLNEKATKEELETIEDNVSELQAKNESLMSDLNNKFNKSNIIKSDDEATGNDDTVYSSFKVDNLLLTKADKDKVDDIAKYTNNLASEINKVDEKYSGLSEKVEKLQDEIKLWEDGESNLAVHNISGNTATISLENFKKFRFLLPDNPIAYEYYNVNYKTQSFCNAQHINGNTYHIEIDMKAPSTYIYVTDLEIIEADNNIKKYEPFIYTLSVSNPEVPTDSTGE